MSNPIKHSTKRALPKPPISTLSNQTANEQDKARFLTELGPLGGLWMQAIKQVNEAQDKADEAKRVAESIAALLQKEAEEAQHKADETKRAAEEAQHKADEAKREADEAQHKADETKRAAEIIGRTQREVLRGEAVPVTQEAVGRPDEES